MKSDTFGHIQRKDPGSPLPISHAHGPAVVAKQNLTPEAAKKAEEVQKAGGLATPATPASPTAPATPAAPATVGGDPKAAAASATPVAPVLPANPN